jgi:hypothetical protein
MSYTINHYNGTLLTTVADGTVDTSTNLTLVGKNYAGYGTAQNDNFIFLLENFANTTQPPNPQTGQIWYDSANKKIKFWNGNYWRTGNGSETATVAPAGLTAGDFWFNTSSNQLYVYNGSSSVLIGPQEVTNFGTTQMLSTSVLDSSNNPHAVIKGIAAGNVIFIISSDSFTLSGTNAINGFDNVVQGLTLVNTIAANNGVTSNGYKFQGTASNSDRLGGQLASAYVTAGTASFSSVVNFSDGGYTVGSPNVKLTVSNVGGVPTVSSAGNIVFNTTTALGSVKNPLILNGLDLLPGASGVSNLGSSGFQWQNIYAGYVWATANKADQLNVGGSYVQASVASNPSTVVARDSNSNINANLFNGTATAAQYADLAEKYLPDAEYSIGTVMAVGGTKEVRECGANDFPIGVISDNPAFMMNKDLVGGVYVALKGRVPVKIIGACSKGDRIVPHGAGFGQADTGSGFPVFAIALEDCTDTDVTLVECVVL